MSPPFDAAPPDEGQLAAALLAAAPDGMLLVDEEGVIVRANPAAAGMFGRSVAELQGLPIEVLVPAPARERHVTHRTHYAAHPEQRPMGSGLALQAVHADGTEFDVEISLSPMTIGGRSFVLAAARDVSERRKIRSRMVQLEDRQRIARDLHDLVIQRLFAAGMSLQAVAVDASPPHVRSTITATIDELDQTIREIRSAIFALGYDAKSRPLSDQLAALVAERRAQLGFTPDFHVEGDIDSIADHVADQLLATVIEGLSNIARHARATDAAVTIARHGDELSLTIADNGVGIPHVPKRRGGIANIIWRAAELGGTCTVKPVDPTGTRLVWVVPVR